MKLIFQNQLTQITRGVKLFSIAGAIGFGLLTPTVFSQEEAPGYAPGSITKKPFSLIQEKEDWTPPSTDAQASPSDWIPPDTDTADEVQRLVVESEDIDTPLVPETAAEEVQLPPPSDSIIEPPPEDIQAPPADMSNSSSFEASPIESLNAPQMLPLPSESSVLMGSSVLSENSQVVTNEFCGEGCSACDTVVGPGAETIVSDGIDYSSQTGNAGAAFAPGAGRGRVLFGKGRSLFGKGRATVANGKSALANRGAGLANGGAAFGRANGAVVQPGFTPVRNILRGVGSRLGQNTEVNSVGQLTFLSFGRDYRGRGRQLSRGVPNLFANGPNENEFTGVDLSYGQRRAGGRGWEMRYIGFNPDRATDIAGSGPQLVWGGLAPPLNDPATWAGGVIDPNTPQTFGLSGIGIGNTSMADVFGDAQNHRVSRDSEFGSFEFNMLRASSGGNRFTCGSSMVELFGGLRAVAFNETMVFTAAATQSAISPSSAFYSSEVKNGLFGLQVGGRLERPLKQGWGLSFGTRVGLYNNRVESRQRAQYQFADGSRPTPVVRFGNDAGREFDFTGTDHELAFLGELDFGVIYRFRPQTRVRVGYRGIAVTNIATAAGQLEDSLFDIDRVTEPNVLGDLIVGGLYFGVDHAF